MIDSVRTRLVLVNVLVLAVLQGLFVILMYKTLSWSLISQQDAILKSFVESTAAEVTMQTRENGGALPAAEQIWIGQRRSSTNYALYDADGDLVAEKTTDNSRMSPLPADWRQMTQQDRYYTLQLNGTAEKGVRRLVARRLASGAILVISRPLDPLLAQLRVVTSFLSVAVPVMLVLSGLGGWFVTRHSLAPVAIMSEEARRISADNVAERLAVSNPRDELGQLATTLNGLLDRLGNALSHQREFMAEAAHQLRTPLSVARTTTQVTLGQPSRAEAEYRDAMTLIEAQMRHLSRIVDDMFRLARADAGFHGLNPQALYLNELVAEAAQAAGVLAAKKNIDVHAANAPDVPFRGDEELLRQMTLNLLENAIKYTPRGGTVEIALRPGAGEWVVEVADDGPPIPEPYREKIFERFFRVPQSGQDAEPAADGAGLGLPIARWIAESHGGSLVLAQDSARGNTFRVTLPENKS